MQGGGGKPCLLDSYRAEGLDPLTLLVHDGACFCRFPKDHWPVIPFDHEAWIRQYYAERNLPCPLDV